MTAPDTGPGDLWFEEKLAAAEQATDALRAHAPLIATAIERWGDVAVALAGHDLNNMRLVVRGEQELNQHRDASVQTLQREVAAVLRRLDTIEETQARIAADLATIAVTLRRQSAPPAAAPGEGAWDDYDGGVGRP
jgi:hypothetical protein